MVASREHRYDLDSGLYDARAISNFILDHFDASKFEISNLKLNKILFFVHGSFLGKFGVPFIKNHFEPWDFGPVVPVVYREFKVHESKPIGTRACYTDVFTKERKVVGYSDIDDSYLPFLNFMVGRYVTLPAGRLVDLTHRPGSPWSQARARVFSGTFSVADRIRNDEILKYFESRNPQGLSASIVSIDGNSEPLHHNVEQRITLDARKVRN